MKLRSSKEEKQVANQQLVKETNLTFIFKLIYKYGPVSRAELAHTTKLSPTTVSSLAEELISNGLVIETGAGETTTSGRKPIMLEVNPRGGYIISLEMLDYGFNCFLYDLKCSEVTSVKYRVEDYDSIGKKIVQAIEEILTGGKIPEDRLLGICVGVPGLIDYENNRVISSTVIPIDENNDFYSIIKARFREIPVLLENESSLCAYAEKEFGTNGNIKNLVFIDYISSGIGSGIILDGSMFRGTFGLSGEIGHISIDINGPKCKCGSRGCLEVMAGTPAIVNKVIFGIMSGRETVISEMVKNDFNQITIDVIRNAVDQGDRLTLEVLDEIAVRLAFGINNIINLFNPQVIVIGGEITRVGETFLQKIKDTVNKIALKPNKSRVEIKYSSLRGNTITLGGARLVLDNIIDSHGFHSKWAITAI